jgi:ABC-type antimicrobial peptide transport system permease subunit
VDAERPELAEGLIAQMNARFPDARASLSSNFAQNTRDMQSTQALGDAIGVLAMLVGGVVVANTMLMTVYERTREIGTLRALGWGRRKIVSQVVVEGLLLCLLAAVMGAALGWLLINLLTSIPVLDSYLAASFDVPSIVRAVALALLVGLIGSAYPAWRASRLQPVEALRYE